jgi:hypothetical protein
VPTDDVVRAALLAVVLLAACGPGDAGMPGVASGGTPPAAPAGGMPASDPGACPSAVTLRVSDGMNGGPVPGLLVRGLAMSCMDQPSATVCTASPPSGSYQLEIGAPGYQDAHVAFAVQSTASGQGSGCSQTVDMAVPLSRG